MREEAAVGGGEGLSWGQWAEAGWCSSAPAQRTRHRVVLALPHKGAAGRAILRGGGHKAGLPVHNLIQAAAREGRRVVEERGRGVGRRRWVLA